MTAAPLVGVVIASRDGERYLGEAIESVLGQTHAAVDLVVVDDGSTTDGTRDVALRYAPAVRCISLPHRGLGPARNSGVSAVRGEVLAFLDHDDLWPEHKLERQLAAFGADPPPDLVFGHIREFVSPELEEALAGRLQCMSEPRPALLPGTMLVSRTALDRVGPFPEQWVTNDFLAWLLTARRLGLRETMVEEHVLWRRLHDDNFSYHADVTRPEYLRVLKEDLDRRRRPTIVPTRP
jgi:glycosyltransferase involved in cell wall biosynthesis